MSLTIFRRHTPTCRTSTIRGLSSREARFFRACSCPCWITGTTDKEKYSRQSLGTTDWAVAEARVRAIQAQAVDAVVHGPTIRDCVRRHLATHTDVVGPRAYEHHRLTLARFEDFARAQNVYHMSELSIDLIEDFIATTCGKLASGTRAFAVSKLKVFLRESHRRGWITEALALKVRSPRAVYEQAQRYSDDEIHRILNEAERLNAVKKYGYASQPETFRLLLELMLETGMRVSDAVRYDPQRCTQSKQLWMYTFEPCKQRRKTTKLRQHEVFLSDRLHGAIDHAPWLSTGLPFAYRPFSVTPVQEFAVYKTMRAIGDRCGVEDCRPHRLRDTFAVRMLLRGVSLENVSRLLGHSSVAVTQAHYAPWCSSRKLRLEELVAEALMQPAGD
jgi:integrase/recombinase XerD